MAERYVRIGSLENIHVYDDAVFDGGIETDDVMKAFKSPVLPEDVLRLDDVGDLTGDVIGPGSSTDNAIVRFDGITGKRIQDSAATINDGGDLTCEDLECEELTVNEIVFIENIKSGATQVAAGAAADELWKTSGHASLPDNVVMIGV
jgi:hypothetical protein